MTMKISMKITKIGTYLMTGDVGNVLLLHPHIFGIVTGNLDAHALVLLP